MRDRRSRRAELQILVESAERTVRRQFAHRHDPASYPGAMDGRAKLLASIDWLVSLRARMDRLVSMSLRRSTRRLYPWPGPVC